MWKILGAIIVASMLLAALKLAIILLLLAGLIFRTKEMVGLFALLGLWAAFKAWPGAGLWLLGVIGAIAFYRATSRSTDATT